MALGKRRSLAATLAYRNDEVIHRFRKEWKVSPATATALFDDLKRFLWMCGGPDGNGLVPVPIIDEMWHAFLMFTVDYRDFTTRYVGRHVEHVPLTKREKDLVRKNPARARRKARAALEHGVSAVYDALGEATARRWYQTYAARYDGRFFRRARHHHSLAARK
jgi:hypothetical protein